MTALQDIAAPRMRGTVMQVLRPCVMAGVLIAMVQPALGRAQAVPVLHGWEAVVVPAGHRASREAGMKAHNVTAKRPAPTASRPASRADVHRVKAASTPAKGPAPGGKGAAAQVPALVPRPASKAVRKYCANIADAAADARFAWQRKTLLTLQAELDERIERLQKKTTEYRKWLARRDEFSKKAQGSLMLIYARMRPDVAAQQLLAMDEETAASLLMKLKPRNASAMLNEMEPARAARLASIIAGAARAGAARSGAARTASTADKAQSRSAAKAPAPEKTAAPGPPGVGR